MVSDVESKEVAHRILDLLNTRIAKLEHLTAFKTNYMIMLFVSVRLLVLIEIFPKLVLSDKVAINEDLEGVVDSCAANTVIALFHMQVQRFCIEVIIPQVDLFENGKSLRGLPQAVFFKIMGKDLLHFTEHLR